MKSFNVIVYNFNTKKFEPYDIMPYLVDRYKRLKAKDRPLSLKKFIENEARYQWWSRCEYEIILSDWPPHGVEEKWDVFKQIMMNIDVIRDILEENI